MKIYGLVVGVAYNENKIELYDMLRYFFNTADKRQQFINKVLPAELGSIYGLSCEVLCMELFEDVIR